LVKTQNLNQSGKYPRFVIVVNKNDLEINVDLSLVKKIIESEPLIVDHFEISCKTGRGLKEFSAWLVENARNEQMGD
jgi:tRNA U34 5-carboxymethylaminomethyl modifying GTPase MnmE/TrmE